MTKIRPKDINVLIACEESQAECVAFRERGFNAFSCDLQKARLNPRIHILGNVTPLLQGQTIFVTESGEVHQVSQWHLIIAHPPCTYLCKAGAIHMVIEGVVQMERYRQMVSGREFFMKCYNAKCDYLAVENPLPMRRAQLPPASCYIHPSDYGVKYTKKTLYWLRNLPPLMAQIIFPNPKQFVRSSRGKYRSRTFPQVAAAIAKQWGDYILDDMNNKQKQKSL